MRLWGMLLAGLIVWALHFFLLYGIGEFAGETRMARVVVLLLTGIALVALVALTLRLRRETLRDGVAHWGGRLALGGVMIAAVAVVWQGLPAMLAS